jgi:hypothetical protein
MTSSPVSVERRIGQRFPFNLPVSFRDLSTGTEGVGFTQDVSSRGAFFLTDMPITRYAEIELTLKMPSEITLGESMRVRCKGRVLRVVKPAGFGSKPENGSSETGSRDKIPSASLPPAQLQEANSATASSIGNGSEQIPSQQTVADRVQASQSPLNPTKIGVAVCLSGYEYLPESEDTSADFRRISALHSPAETTRLKPSGTDHGRSAGD